jgi:hypothetical protein
MSSTRTSRPRPSTTGICVVGRGNPASTSNSRSQVSRGDAAPPSTRGSTVLRDLSPRAPGYCCAYAHHVLHGVGRRVLQRVEPSHGVVTRQVTRQVEGRARQGRNRNARDLRHLVGGECLVADQQTGVTACAARDQFDGLRRVDPLRAVQSRRGRARDHAAALRPQPRGDGPVAQRQIVLAGGVDVRKHAGIPAGQRVSRAAGLASDHDFPHVGSMPSAPDTRDRRYATKVRLELLRGVDLANERGSRARGREGTPACTPRGSRSSDRGREHPARHRQRRRRRRDRPTPEKRRPTA